MNTIAIDDAIAIRVAVEIEPLAEYLDDHDAGCVPANPIAYQAISQRIKIVLQPHLDNTHVRTVCNASRSLSEILENLLMERDQELALQIENAIDALNSIAYGLR